MLRDSPHGVCWQAGSSAPHQPCPAGPSMTYQHSVEQSKSNTSLIKLDSQYTQTSCSVGGGGGVAQLYAGID